MKFNAALLVISLVAFFPFSARPCENLATCSCGKTGENVTFCATGLNMGDPCSPLSRCRTCRQGIKTCWECPEGFGGPFCDQDNSNVFCDNPGTINFGQAVLDLASVPASISIDDPEFPLGTRLLYTCKSGYISGLGPDSVTCKENGFWSNEPPFCRKISTRISLPCSDPTSIPNGRILSAFIAGSRPGSDGYPTGSRLGYSCDEGFTLVGSPNRICEISGFWSSKTPTCEIDCGRTFRKSNDRNINDKQKPQVHNWPWIVEIYARNHLICNGALLDPTTVLTTAHCLRESKDLRLQFGRMRSYGLQREKKIEIRNSVRIHIHPHYKITTKEYDSDIGLIFFEPRVHFTRNIQPICLPTWATTIDNLVLGKIGTVPAWGDNPKANLREFPLKNSTYLKVSNIPIRTNPECIKTYRRWFGMGLNLTVNQFCAGEEVMRHELDMGTSGAAMVFYDNKTERYTVQGLNSLGMETGNRPRGYSVFTNVYQFVPWIRCSMIHRECHIV